ncbi:MAG: ATP-binding protein [Pseudolysinimonas sp.]|uniref:sensor histidine kinase n=1 Tax=Pseudolysinimonas sp. TaxID=2680009 RepID=UPI0032671C68
MTWRLFAAFAGLVLLALLVQDIPLAGYLSATERERIVTALERDAFLLAGRSEEALHSATPDADGGITALAKAYRDAGGARTIIVDRAGVVVVSSDDDPVAVGQSYLSRAEIAQALAGGVVSGERFSQTLNQQLLYVAVPVLSGSEVFGAVRLTYPASEIDAAVNRKVVTLGLVGLVTVLLAGLIGMVLSRSITRRLRLLRDATERFAGGERGVRADPAEGAPELRSLARSFNDMASRVDDAMEQQRGFAADASHQLRTPLTALRLRLERARVLVESGDRDAAVERLDAAENEVERLELLVEGLLMLSRAEAKEAPLVVVDLADVARDRVEQWAALAEESGRTVSCEAPTTSRVLAVPTALEQIVDNLIDNALAVSPNAAAVEVRVTTVGGHVELHVLDRGPGLPEADRHRAFDRFWRGSSTTPGSGLGLAIVAQFARLSGAEARLDSREGGGLDAVVRFQRPTGLSGL